MFEFDPLGLVVLIVPVVTMRLVAEEKRSGTLEMLITLPVSDSEVILGKFLGALGLVLVLIASTALYPILMFKRPWHLGALDTGPVCAATSGSLLFSAAAVAIGLLISSLTESQVIAFFITFIVLGCLYFVGEAGALVPESCSATCSASSASTRPTPRSQRGLIDTRDIVFFLSFAALALLSPSALSRAGSGPEGSRHGT